MFVKYFVYSVVFFVFGWCFEVGIKTSKKQEIVYTADI